jgi:hypothetical protein
VARSADGLVWTAAGKTALALEKARELVPRDTDVKKAVAAIVKQHAARWKKGAARSDDAGKAAIAAAAAWKPAAKPTAEQLAAMMSLAAAAPVSVHNVVIELAIRERGWELTMRMLAASWTLYASYDKGASWLKAIAVDHDHVFDTSACCGKGEMTRYLQAYYYAAASSERTAMRKAVGAVWKDAHRPGKVALAVATCDAGRGATIARELLANDKPHAFFAWQELPHILTDAELVAAALEKRDESLSFRIVENLGAAAVPLFEDRMAGISKHQRARLLEMLANVRSRRVAHILAEYAEDKPYADTVRGYFALHPDLLAAALADPELRYYHPELLVVHRTLNPSAS